MDSDHQSFNAGRCKKLGGSEHGGPIGRDGYPRLCSSPDPMHLPLGTFNATRS
ncbi:MAG: hypothetical protein AVDCRST_MAG19-1596 [uncultured Thermomicrobiales bacterium]|uniref:Uncharacterized protein n=1 Tax=uncultured Thermomicrobiales bacterium TaxID=1645740 RepID=A0A6J4U7D2_9BACT|nr:MAG: hypothetical protein AVDCRST_MAG19-1596 [uncultured Thermomicrobiales bacterium]